MIEVPPAFAESTVAREGAPGRRWVEGLPRLVEELRGFWGLELDGPPTHGYVGLVVPVRRGEEPLVLKVSWIDRSSEQEALALRAWDGRGSVRLIDARDDVGGMLLERLDADRTLLDVPESEAVRVAATLLRRLAVPAPSDLRTVRADLDQFRDEAPGRWEAAGRPLARGLLEAALEEAARPSPGPLRLVNQDLHYENVLAGQRERWLVIDPKPLAGDPAFGVAPLLWNRFGELRGAADFDHRLARIVDAAELDPVRARGLTLVRLVDYWIWASEVGLSRDPGTCRTLIGWLRPDLPI